MSKNPIPGELIEILFKARRVAVLTGAGVSKESGLATFREAQTGMWAQYRPEDLATPQAFGKNPERVWLWYQWRRGLVSQAQPNPGHYSLVHMANHVLYRDAEDEESQATFELITQNVDGLHQMAGSSGVVELHGNIRRTRCNECGQIATTWANRDPEAPLCPQGDCEGLLRPAVVWYGETLPREALRAALAAAENCDVFFSIGTSALVQPAASLPQLALEAGACVVEINPNATPLTRYLYLRSLNHHANPSKPEPKLKKLTKPQSFKMGAKRKDCFFIPGSSGEILPMLVRQTWG